ncbi:MAG: hypothetical protein HS111_17970 [Kofleriaceae bacterium]|nr:hypothetical protein [Kofleriaceae bacterium]MCL4228260.1 hypothetical protein [Myxococcales bacterium]
MLSRRPAVAAAVAVVALAALVSLVGCGGGQTKAARTARYRAEATVVFAAVIQAVGVKNKVERADAPSGVVLTVPRWFRPQGTYSMADATGEQYMLEDGSILLRHEIRVVGGDGEYKVEVIPHIAQMRSGYAQPIPLKPDDLAVPGWVHGRTDSLYLEIYERLKEYEVKPGT